MLVAHLAATVAAGWWLWRGEVAVRRLVRLTAETVTAPVHARAASLRGVLALLAVLRGGVDEGSRAAAVRFVPAAGRWWLPRWTSLKKGQDHVADIVSRPLENGEFEALMAAVDRNPGTRRTPPSTTCVPCTFPLASSMNPGLPDRLSDAGSCSPPQRSLSRWTSGRRAGSHDRSVRTSEPSGRDRVMRAPRFARFRSPGDVLEIVDIPAPGTGDDEALVAIKAASVNPSDVRISSPTREHRERTLSYGD
ncbi:hypothetical protein [Kitasatospora sp. NPDC087314]|uniref:hypothetical protein n=1 Tax=Kitasatospora sp. NPDC087314 TaxID=3364068 RepID=UPI003803CB85